MTQTLALLLDAYRELNARKMFWISLIISGLVMIAFALLGVDDKKLTFAGLDLPMPAPRFFYKYLFSVVVIGMWVSVGAMILAMISTASIFPDLLASGSVDLYLSKPISRWRLFLTKYSGGLLFVLLQATVFAVGGYLVFGLRAGIWNGSLFLIIPLATLLFSYLFAVSVLVGVFTRSTIAAILLTCVFWFLCFVTNKAEQTLFLFRTMHTAQVRAYERQVQKTEEELADLKKNPSVTNVFGIRERRLKQRLEELRSSAAETAKTARKLTTAHRIVRGVATVIPKTGETVDLLDRKLFSESDRDAFRKDFEGGESGFVPPPPPPPEAYEVSTTGPTTGPTTAESAELAAQHAREWEQRRAAEREAAEEAERAALSRSIPWIIGTSVGFEVVVVSLACWIFCRRDY